METEQTAATCQAPGQTPVRTWLPSSSRGTPSDTASRLHGDGVRYKAKLIGVDPVPDARGEKMCYDSMMKLKGFQEAARKQGKHKQRIWLKVSSSGLRIVDERTASVLQVHDRTRISSLTRDESDPRALAYVYQHENAYFLYYIKMANLADPVLVDIQEVCQTVEEATQQEPAETSTQTSSLVLLNDSSAPPAEAPAASEDVLSPRPDSSPGQLNQTSSSNELMQIFSVPMEEPMMPDRSLCTTSQPESPQSPQPPQPPQPMLSTSQILSMFPPQPPGGSPYSSPPYSPTTMPWGQQGLLGNQWAGPAAAPWPAMPGGMAAWAPAGMAAPPAGGQIQAQPGVTPASPTAVSGYPAPLNPCSAPAGAAGAQQPASATWDQNLLNF